MSIFPLILQLGALACFVFSAFGLFTGGGKPQWGWSGLFLWLLSLMITAIDLHTARG